MPNLSTFARNTGLPIQRRWKDVYTQVKGLATRSSTDKPKSPGLIKVSKEIEQIARYLIEPDGFSDWWLNGKYILEPGIRRLIGQKSKVIGVHIENLRPDWQDDAQYAQDAWGALGFEFKNVSKMTADIIVDDEKDGAWAKRPFFIYQKDRNGKPVIHSTSPREINVSKEWPEWSIRGTITHEYGHTLGLGHPGPYNGAGWQDKKIYPQDSSDVTVMSYFGRTIKIGPADKLAIEMLYDM